jgi:hypothetical protein
MLKTSPHRLCLVLIAIAVCMLLALPALAESQARIVRLSDVQGSVQIDKNTGLGFEHAFVNLPITQGVQLRTGNNGRAEIEFEDGSSMRLAPDSVVEFSRLGLSDAGKRISQVNLIQGMAYVNWLGKDDLAMNFSHQKLTLEHAAHLRVDASDQLGNLAVFKGDVDVEGPAGKLTVEKNKSATFNAADEDKYTVAKKIPEEPLDSWDKEAISYHDQYAKNRVSSPYGYGLSDLNYYGAFSNVPGYGMMWQPYFTGIGWDPFMDGAWGFYPGYGYMFASAYPWGWMPYRYGNWMFLPGMGWMWQPGSFNTWVGVPRYTATNLTHMTSLVPPTSGARTVIVGRAGAMSTMQTPRMTLNAGSAGMGIARGSLENLNHLNHQVTKSGFAEVRPAPQFAATSPMRSYSSFGGESRSASRGSMATGPSTHSTGSAPAAHSTGGGGSHH